MAVYELLTGVMATNPHEKTPGDLAWAHAIAAFAKIGSTTLPVLF